MSSLSRHSALREALLEKGLSGHSVDTIATYLEEARLPYGYEKDVKRHIRDALDEAGIPYQTNVKVGRRGYVSFLIAGCIALCCYIDAGLSSIAAQVEGLARTSWVDGVIVVTSRDLHLGDGYISGKPAAIVKPSRAWTYS